MYKNSKVHDTHRKYTHNAPQLKENSTVYDTPWCFLTFLPTINYSFTSKLLEINLINGKLQREYVLVYIRLQRIAIQMSVFVLCRRLSELMQMNERERGSM